MKRPQPWPLGISTCLYEGEPLLATLPRLHRLGLPLLEISSFPGHFDYHDRTLARRARQELAALGLAVHSLHAPFGPAADITALDDTARWQAVQELKAAAEALRELGGRVLVVHPGGEVGANSSSVMARLRRSANSLIELHSHCRALGLTLAIEDMLPHLLAGRTGDLLWLMEQLPDDGAGFCLDTGHSFLARELVQRIELFGPSLLQLHLHDNRGTFDDHLPPGEGAIDWPEVMASLHRVGFDGVLMLEVGRAVGAANLEARVQRSVEAIVRWAAWPLGV